MDFKVTVAAIVLLVVIIVIVSAITLVLITYVYIWYLILINSNVLVYIGYQRYLNQNNVLCWVTFDKIAKFVTKLWSGFL